MTPTDTLDPALIVCEIFRSIQGETSYAGLPCTFVRTSGCNLNCNYCDTEYARTGEGNRMAVDDVARRVEELGAQLVCITGGEPLLQAPAVAALGEALLAAGHTVLLETNGTLDFGRMPEDVVVIMDVKCPGSGESGRTLPNNLERMRPRDEVKFVLSDRSDFEWAVRFVRERGWEKAGPHVLFAPVHGRLPGRELAEWILDSGLRVRLQLQLHKILWPDRERGV